jgi:radical SAM protein with 4Fe4S-binding SPASM domain
VGNRRLGEGLFLEPGERFDWPDPAAPDSGTEFCHGLRSQIAVLCDGTVVPCCLDSEGRLALGNLHRQELAEILVSPRATAMATGFSRRQPSEELCRRCGYAARFSR